MKIQKIKAVKYQIFFEKHDIQTQYQNVSDFIMIFLVFLVIKVRTRQIYYNKSQHLLIPDVVNFLCLLLLFNQINHKILLSVFIYSLKIYNQKFVIYICKVTLKKSQRKH